MNLFDFDYVLDEIYKKVKQERSQNNNFNYLLRYTISLWSEKIGLRNDINHSNIFTDIEQISYDIWIEWRTDGKTPVPPSNLYKIIQKFINKLPLRSQKVKDIKFIVFLGLVITGVAVVVYQLNQQKTATSNRKPLSGDDNYPSYPLPEPKTLILVVNALKKDCLDKLESQGNKIQSEDCEKLYRATSFLWMGDKLQLHPQLDQNLNNNAIYVAQSGIESEYDVYLLKIELPKANEGFEQNAGQLSRIDAFRGLEGLFVQISPRLKVSVYENTNVYTR